MLAGIGSGNMYFKISPTREIAKMIKNCLMNFMLVLPVFSSDCRGRVGFPGRVGPRPVELVKPRGVPRPAELVLPIIIYLCAVLSR